MTTQETLFPGAGPTQTAWSVVLGARDLTGPDQARMLDRLISDYWRPVYRFIRLQWNASEDEARDLTQGYFLHFMEHDLLESVSPDKGRFRTFVRVTLQRFLVNQRRAENTAKRGGHNRNLPIDWVRAEAEEAGRKNPALSADEQFDRLWAADVLDRAVGLLQAELKKENQTDWFEAFRLCCLETPALSYREAGAKLGLKEGDVRNRIFQVRKRLRSQVRIQIRESVSEDALVDTELGYMMRLLESPPE